MHFIVEQKILLQPAQKLNSLLSTNTENPIISHILLKIKSNYLFLISTNLEIELISRISCKKIYQDGNAIISGKKFFNIIRSFPSNSTIEIKIKNNHMKIFHKNIFFIISILQNKNFPKFKTENNITEILIPQKKLRNIIFNTHFSMAKQDVRHYLNGLCLEIRDKKMSAITTDGYRMSISSINLENSIKYQSIVIPSRTIKELIKILQETSELFKMKIGSKILKICTKKYIMSSKLIDHKFPDYKSILIQDFQTKISVNRNQLKSALNRAAILSHHKSQGVKLSFKNQTCIISSRNEHEEIIQEKFQINYSNKIIELTINIQYIMEVINIINDHDIKILLNDSTNSIYIKHIKEYNSIYIIMPLII